MQNPIDITIQRTEKIRSGGGFSETISTLGPFAVRIYANESRIQRSESGLIGSQQKNFWGLLADDQADIKAGSNVIDVFDVPGLGHFYVVNVYPQVVNGELVGYHVDLERID